MTRALVLGGGGIAGIAWEIGLLNGLAEGGVDVTGADLVVGTSAGSVVAAQITSGAALPGLLRAQTDPDAQAPEIAAEVDMDRLVELFGVTADQDADPLEVRRRIGRAALDAPTVAEERRREVIAGRLPVHTWPATKVLIVAVDAETGQERVFDADSGVELVDAVTASCAVPVVWPPVTIGGTRYVDGGVRSGENADLATGHDVVLVLQAMRVEGMDALGGQVDALRQEGSSVLVIGTDEPSVAAIGPNPLDPATREPTARAGREQGLRIAAEVAAFWK
ncbi:patatin-like phospholipase family protein [Umezawaea tangerina]|uniref:NTE family protein n=1 Tax=Umezawaea tangerina TaxID=84725 RepID=A0A2T0SYX2_9PSEU|nr:patatin-like phospholipase family protein [Umezawaea tangerina]PRY38612.1 NTE family protein [Umezawaea tangerina]